MCLNAFCPALRQVMPLGRHDLTCLYGFSDPKPQRHRPHYGACPANRSVRQLDAPSPAPVPALEPRPSRDTAAPVPRAAAITCLSPSCACPGSRVNGCKLRAANGLPDDPEATCCANLPADPACWKACLSPFAGLLDRACPGTGRLSGLVGDSRWVVCGNGDVGPAFVGMGRMSRARWVGFARVVR